MPDARESLQALMRGQNGLLDPMVVNPQFASRLYNVTIRDGLAQTRPGTLGTELPVQGKFQGAFEYRLEGADYWVVVISGQVWLLNTNTDVWTHVSTFPTTDFDRAYFAQADRYGIVQNGIYDPVENWPIIFHGTVLVDNLATQYFEGNTLVTVSNFTGNAGGPETIRVPIGTSMAYGHGRLFVAVDRYYDDGASGGTVGWKENLGNRFWVAGNILQIGNIQSILVFSDQYLLNYGNAFSLPAEVGFITAMAFLRNDDSGSGLGALIIFCRRGAVAFAVNISRDKGSWLSAGFGQVLFMSSGTNSPWGVTPVNSDLVYYGDDGLRTLKYSASSEAGSNGLATVPLSPEIYNFTRLTDRRAHAPWVSLAHVDNYVFMTAGGLQLADGSIAFRGALPWDLASFQVSGESAGRVFAGAWCGKLFHAVLGYRPNGETLGAIFRDSETGSLKYGAFQTTQFDQAISSIRTASYVFNSPLNLKKVKFIDAMFDRVNGPLEVWFRWRFEGSSTWYTSLVRRFNGTNGVTGFFRVPVDEIDDAGFTVQFAVEWRGVARLKLAIFTAALIDRYTGEINDCGVQQLVTQENDDLDFGCPQLPIGVET
jgi:hypothetical protein